jgi:hypothetical protein
MSTVTVKSVFIDRQSNTTYNSCQSETETTCFGCMQLEHVASVSLWQLLYVVLECLSINTCLLTQKDGICETKVTVKVEIFTLLECYIA